MLAAAMARDPDRFVTELIAQNLALAGRCAAQPEVSISETLKDMVRRALVERTQDASADLRARIAAGLALGEQAIRVSCAARTLWRLPAAAAGRNPWRDVSHRQQ